MKVLVISNTALCMNNSNSMVLLNDLSCLPKEDIASFYIQDTIPDKDVASVHFKTTDKEHLKHFFKKSNLGQIIYDKDIHSDIKPSIQVGKHKSIKESALGHAIREFIWKHGKWDKTNLYKFIDEFKPTVILFLCGRSSFMNNITLELSNKYHLPVVVYTSEDEYFHKYSWYKIIKNPLQRKLIASYKNLMKNTSLAICQNDKLNGLFANEFNAKTKTIMISSSFPIEDNHIDNVEGDIIYMGNIQPNRLSSLIYISQCLYGLDDSLKIDIYCPDMTKKIFNEISKFTNIVIHEKVSKEESIKIIKKARLLLHFESFKKKDKVMLQTSFSGKIADSLSSGVPFLVLAPVYCGFSDYFKEHSDAVLYADEKYKLKQMLIDGLENIEYRNNLVSNALTLAKENHNKEKNSKEFISLLSGIKNE